VNLLIWLIGFLAAVAVLALGYAAADLLTGVLRRAYELGLAGPAAKALRPFQARLRRPRAPAERLSLPPALRTALAVLRRPNPVIALPAAMGFVAALFSRDLLISPHLLLLGLAASLYLAYRQGLAERQRVGDQVRRLLEAYVGLYRVNPTPFATLALAAEHVPAGPVREAVLAAVQHYDATRDARGALASLLPAAAAAGRLMAVRDPYLARFALVLGQAGEQSPGEILNLLSDLQARLRRRWLTRLNAQGVFAALRGTLAVLVGAAAVVTSVGATVPLWRGIHTASNGRRLFFIALTTVAFLVAAYFDRRMRLDEEALL
jgi:hypothetical protein